jgi:hypothetical protein
VAALLAIVPAASPSSVSAAQGDPRFGVIATGSVPDISAALQTVAASEWYQFAEPRADPASRRVGMVRPGVNLADLASNAQAKPGGTYIVGNEPNVPGQDNLSPAVYADFLFSVANAIRGADPSAKLVGPNVLNWDNTCTLCGGFTSGRIWSEAFVSSYQTRYGALPLHAWGMHTYSLDWEHLPLINAAADQAQLTAARTWLNGRGLALPIWNTEFGVIWGYTGIEWVSQSDGSLRAVPRGTFRSDLITTYLTQMFDWLTQNSASLNIQRWFLYGLVAVPEPWATAPAGIGLLEPGSLQMTSFGLQHWAWAAVPVCAPRSNVGVSVVPAGSNQLQVTITSPMSAGAQLQALNFGEATGGVFDVGGSTGLRGPFSTTFPRGTTATSFIVRQTAAYVTVPLTVMDSCGAWSTFVGRGPSGLTGSAPSAPQAPQPSPGLPSASGPTGAPEAAGRSAPAGGRAAFLPLLPTTVTPTPTPARGATGTATATATVTPTPAGSVSANPSQFAIGIGGRPEASSCAALPAGCPGSTAAGVGQGAPNAAGAVASRSGLGLTAPQALGPVQPGGQHGVPWQAARPRLPPLPPALPPLPPAPLVPVAPLPVVAPPAASVAFPEVPTIPEADSLPLLGSGLTALAGLVALRALRRRGPD